jgi:hypothetical protein
MIRISEVIKFSERVVDVNFKTEARDGSLVRLQFWKRLLIGVYLHD